MCGGGMCVPHRTVCQCLIYVRGIRDGREQEYRDGVPRSLCVCTYWLRSAFLWIYVPAYCVCAGLRVVIRLSCTYAVHIPICLRCYLVWVGIGPLSSAMH